MISAATPLLLSSLGGALTYYAGIFNIAMEGMMLSGAFFAVLGSYTFGSWEAGLICGVAGAMVKFHVCDGCCEPRGLRGPD